MKKIFLSFLAIIAMVGMVNAQRTWAYGLNMTQEGDNYTFVFKSTTAATAANLVFTNEAGEVAGKVALENVVAGENTKVLALADIPGEGALNWSVELTGAAIEELIDLTDDPSYKFYLPQDIAVDNNPESDYFGYIYIAEGTDGDASDATVERTAKQKRGIFVFDQTLKELNPTNNVGIVPSNVTLSDASRQGIHRLAINPVNNQVAFAYNVKNASAVWSMNPANLTGEAANLIEGLPVTSANSICFDEVGALYVMDNAADNGEGGSVVKVVNGALDTVVTSALWASSDNSLVSDGRGGLWVAQHRYSVDKFAALSHINAKGEVDFAVTNSSSDDLKNLFPLNGNVSYRGQCAYNLKNDVLAFGGAKVATLFQVTYDETTGVPSLKKLLATPAMGNNIDGLAFDYAGDLYVMCASNERFYKFALPTENNTCTTPAKKAQVIVKEAPAPVKYTVTVTATAEGEDVVTGGGEYAAGEEVTVTASEELDGWVFIGWTEDGEFVANDPEYTFVVDGDIELVAVYAMDLGVNEVTDLVIDGDNRLLTGSIAGFPMGTMNLELALGEYDEEEGAYLLTEESKLYVGETNFTFVDGMAAVDMNTNSAMAIVVFEDNGTYYYMTVNMSAATAEPVELVLTDAIVAINEETGTLTFNVPTEEGEGYYVELAGYTEPGVYEGPQVCLLETPEVVAFGTYAEVVVENGVYTLTCNGMASPMGQTFDLTVSGTVQQGPTGVENLNGAVAPVKMIENGQLIVIKDGVKFNAQGAVVK